MGIEYYRINTEFLFTKYIHEFEISSKTGADRFQISGFDRDLDVSSITGVWYRRPVPPLPDPSLNTLQSRKFAADEGDYYVRCLWRMLDRCHWVSRPRAISWANVKLHQLRLARDLGFKIPKSMATNDPQAALRFYEQCQGRIIVKPFTVSTLDYDPHYVSILTSRVTENEISRVSQVGKSITFLEEEIPKLFEVRVTVIGQDVFSAKIDSQADDRRKVDWRRTSPNEPIWQDHSVPRWLGESCRQMVSEYGLSFGAFDFAYTPDDDYVFFELNPNGQWAWLEIQLGLPMSSSLARALGQ